MSNFNPNSDRESNPDELEAWQQYCREREAEYQEWLENQREAEAKEQQDREYEAQHLEQQRQDEQRRLDQQRQRDANRRKAERPTSRDQQRTLERVLYDRQQQSIQEENRSISDPKKGLDRHDFYNIETAHELEAAMGRARHQGVNPANEKQFQRFLDREAAQGINQVEGKRSLADRYKELRERRDEAIAAMQRGAPADQIPSMKLYESTWEQQHRRAHERQVFQENREWAQSLDVKQAQLHQSVSPAQQRLAEIRSQQSTQPIERTPARERLDQMRVRHNNTDPDKDDRNPFKGKSR